MCGKCFLTETQVSLVPAAVLVKNQQVILQIDCVKKHGKSELLYCSDMEFFSRMMREQKMLSQNELFDIEDLRQKPDMFNNDALIFEIDASSGDTLFSEQVILDKAQQLLKGTQSLVEEEEKKAKPVRHYVWKINGGALRHKATLVEFNSLVSIAFCVQWLERV
jgi:hypothetical protein